MSGFSDYIVYVDESGDHGLKTIDPNYPVFVLAFCIFHKRDYMEVLVPALQAFKFRHFGHDQVILHERDIRKDRKDFAFLKDRSRKSAFLEELSQIVADTPFSLICSVIRKEPFRRRYTNPKNPYHVALTFGLERVFYYLEGQKAGSQRAHIIVERRGKKEDNEMELEFRRICDGRNFPQKTLPFELIFADKQSNSAGLQLADLVARPVGMHILRPEQENHAFRVLEQKFYCDGNGRRDGWGLKRFP